MTKSTALLPTVNQATQFQGMFDYLNQTLFNSELHSCMLVFSRNANVIAGYFSPDKWTNEDTDTVIHEIGLNANAIKQQSFLDVIDTLVHEMIHLEQHLKGTASRRGYHNKDFVKRCHDLGLATEGGGQELCTMIKPDGLAEKAALDMPDDLLFDWTALPLYDDDKTPNQGEGKPEDQAQPNQPTQTTSGKRISYQCPVCGSKVWGKSGMYIICGSCSQNMIESK